LEQPGVDTGAPNDHNACMTQSMERFAMQAAWDRASEHYLGWRGDDVDFVSYGNLAPGEDELRLLGDLRGQRVLDIGCGGGHNAVACARAGATVVGLDISAVQLRAARRLAQTHGVEVEWLHGDGMSLQGWQAARFDLILAIQVLPYVDGVATLLHITRNLLQPGGRLVFSIDHPIRNCFIDSDADELSPYPVRSYFDTQPLLWNFATEVPMQALHRPLGQWIEWVLGAGLRLQQLIEAPVPQALAAELWPEDSPLYPLHTLPHTAIFVAYAPSG
jgi:SAM-dependent methyltransferase